jgi:hypothetical protein
MSDPAYKDAIYLCWTKNRAALPQNLMFTDAEEAPTLHIADALRYKGGRHLRELLPAFHPDEHIYIWSEGAVEMARQSMSMAIVFVLTFPAELPKNSAIAVCGECRNAYDMLTWYTPCCLDEDEVCFVGGTSAQEGATTLQRLLKSEPPCDVQPVQAGKAWTWGKLCVVSTVAEMCILASFMYPPSAFDKPARSPFHLALLQVSHVINEHRNRAYNIGVVNGTIGHMYFPSVVNLPPHKPTPMLNCISAKVVHSHMMDERSAPREIGNLKVFVANDIRRNDDAYFDCFAAIQNVMNVLEPMSVLVDYDDLLPTVRCVLCGGSSSLALTLALLGFRGSKSIVTTGEIGDWKETQTVPGILPIGELEVKLLSEQFVIFPLMNFVADRAMEVNTMRKYGEPFDIRDVIKGHHRGSKKYATVRDLGDALLVTAVAHMQI